MYKRRRILVISLDGGTWHLLQPLMEEGWLPNLRRLIEAGQAGILRSLISPVTLAAWRSFRTEANPKKREIYNLASIDRYALAVEDRLRDSKISLGGGL